MGIRLPPAEGKLTPEAAPKESGGARALYVRRKDVEGQFTLGCPGCIAIQAGLPVRSHSAECRTLVQQRLAATEEGKVRVEEARKRKAEGVPEGEEKRGDDQEPILFDDVPDEAEEMNGPDAIGSPAQERTDSLGRSAPEGPQEDRASSMSRPTPFKRVVEGGGGGGVQGGEKGQTDRAQGNKEEGDHRSFRGSKEHQAMVR